MAQLLDARSLRRSLATFAIGLAALAGSVAQAAPAAVAEPEYTLAVSAPEMKVGEDSAIHIKVDVAPGYHWNDEYPAHFALIGAPADLELAKTSVSQLAGDFKSETPNLVNVAMKATPKAATVVPLTLEAKFSVCNQRICLIKSATAIVMVVAK